MAARTGYSKMQLHEIKNSLVEQGYLRLVRRTKQDGGQDSNGYDFAGLLEAIRDMLQPHSAPQPVRAEGQVVDADSGRRRQGRAAAQKRVQNGEKEAVKEVTGVEVVGRTGQSVNGLTGVADNRLTGEEVRKLTGETDMGLTRTVKRASGTGRHAGLPGRRMQGAPYIETSRIEKEKDDSNQITRIEKRKDGTSEERRPEYSPFIAQVITDFSQELGDAEHIVSNVSQALRLWEKSGLGEEEYVGCLYDAKGLTRKYQARPHNDAMQNKMAYFFTVLRSLVG
jgi:hypothetical protein